MDPRVLRTGVTPRPLPRLPFESRPGLRPAAGARATAVTDRALTVAPGGIVCVVGESGSGKSVTAHSVMGLLPKGQLTPSAGRQLLEGEEVPAASPAGLRVLRGPRMGDVL